MIRVGAGTQHKKRKKNSRPKFLSSTLCDQNFSSAFALKKTPKSFPLDTQYTSKKTKEMVKITKSTRSLFLSCGSFSLSFSLSLLFPCCAFFAFVFFLSLLSKCVCVRVCARVSVCLERPDLRLGVLFPSQPQVFFSCAHVLTFPLFIITSSFHSVCCIGAGYVGGPTMAMIALKCPHIEVIL